jgi:hypothetical protein
MVVALKGQVAPRQRRENVGIVNFGFLDVAHLRKFRGGYGEMPDCLIVASALKVGPPKREVRRDKSKIRLAVREDHNFGDCHLMHASLQHFLRTCFQEVSLKVIKKRLKIPSEKGQLNRILSIFLLLLRDNLHNLGLQITHKDVLIMFRRNVAIDIADKVEFFSLVAIFFFYHRTL